MKRIFQIALLSMCLLGTSCSDFLDESPKSTLTPENSFESADDWSKILTGAYAHLQDVFVGKYTITLGEFGTDEVEPYDVGWAAYAELRNYTFSASHAFFNDHYIYCYDGIKRCNTVIDIPSEAAVKGEAKELLIAQAKFLRAIFYFDLVRMYGGVPLWTESSVDKDQIMKPRATADEVYEQIVKDMTDAEAILPESWTASADKGRATKHAVNALLGRIYLQWGKPAEAYTALSKVYGKFHLYDNYADIFLPANKNAEYENIFEVQFSHSGAWGLEGSIQASYWGPRNVGGPTNGGGWGGFGITQYLYDSFDDSDLRKQDFFWTSFNGVVQTPPCIKKFYDATYGYEIEDDDLNFIMIRYADVLLMISEALCDMGGDQTQMYDCLNQVRSRAGLPAITAANNLTTEQFKSLLLEERLHELCCEHLRRWDLLRFGKLFDQLEVAYSGTLTLAPYHVLYPIPQTAIDANDAITENNPGY